MKKNQMIELREVEPRNGSYVTKPLMVNANEIAAVNEESNGYDTFTVIHMKSGKVFFVENPIDDVRLMIREAMR